MCENRTPEVLERSIKNQKSVNLFVSVASTPVQESTVPVLQNPASYGARADVTRSEPNGHGGV